MDPNGRPLEVSALHPALVPTAAAPSPRPARPTNPHHERYLLVIACDYRSDALEECGCKARKHCGLARGAFPDELHAVNYSDCLRCVSAT